MNEKICYCSACIIILVIYANVLFYVLCITLMFVIINWPDATQVAFLTPETELYVILFTQEKTTG